jgi:hypothetical protein
MHHSLNATTLTGLPHYLEFLHPDAKVLMLNLTSIAFLKLNLNTAFQALLPFFSQIGSNSKLIGKLFGVIA